MTCCPRNTLQLALGAALAARRPVLVRYLLSSQGNRACALVIAAWPIRQIADLLSILPHAEQAEIFLCLPFRTRTRLLKMGISSTKPDSISSTTATYQKFKTGFYKLGLFVVRVACSHHKKHLGFAPSQTGVTINQQPAIKRLLK